MEPDVHRFIRLFEGLHPETLKRLKGAPWEDKFPDFFAPGEKRRVEQLLPVSELPGHTRIREFLDYIGIDGKRLQLNGRLDDPEKGMKIARVLRPLVNAQLANGYIDFKGKKTVWEGLPGLAAKIVGFFKFFSNVSSNPDRQIGGASDDKPNVEVVSGGDFQLVFSRDPEDMAKASTDREWETCWTGEYDHGLDPDLLAKIHDNEDGERIEGWYSMICYVTPIGDDNIERPIGRLFVNRSFYAQTGEINFSFSDFAGTLPISTMQTLDSLFDKSKERKWHDRWGSHANPLEAWIDEEDQWAIFFDPEDVDVSVLRKFIGAKGQIFGFEWENAFIRGTDKKGKQATIGLLATGNINRIRDQFGEIVQKVPNAERILEMTPEAQKTFISSLPTDMQFWAELAVDLGPILTLLDTYEAEPVRVIDYNVVIPSELLYR